MKINGGGMMKIRSEKIDARLKEIRRQVGGKLRPFIPDARPIDEDLPEGKSVASLFHESGLLIYRGRPVFAYIPDHTVGEFYSAEDRKRIHFTVCHTLDRMRRNNLFFKYRITSRDDNLYRIDVPAGEREEPLYPCRHCLRKSGYLCFAEASDEQRDDIVRRFDARAAFPLLREQFAVFQETMKGVKPAALPTGYTKKWRTFSREFKKSRHFVCDKCNVHLVGQDAGLLDVHHIVPEKRNVREDNLRCLCKLCHGKEHSHYRVNAEVRQRIKAARFRQGVIVAD